MASKRDQIQRYRASDRGVRSPPVKNLYFGGMSLLALSEYTQHFKQLPVPPYAHLFDKAHFVLLNQNVRLFEKLLARRCEIERVGATIRHGWPALQKSPGFQAVQQRNQAGRDDADHLR